MKRILCAACALLCFLLVSCGTEAPADPPAVPEQTEPPLNGITREELASYAVILDKGAEKKLYTVASSLTAFFSDAYGITVPEYTNKEKGGDGKPLAGPYEILIGDTGREESDRFIDTLRQNDYGWQMIGDKLVIAGKTDDTTYRAVKNFMNAIKKETDMVYNGEPYTALGNYSIGRLTVGGVSVGDFCIVRKTDDMTAAESYALRVYAETLRNQILAASGFELKTSLTEGKQKILLKKDEALAEDAARIQFSEGDVQITAGSLEAMHEAIARFSVSFAGVKADAVDIPAETVEITRPVSGEDTAMSYNIWVGGTGKGKQEPVAATILNLLPDTLGLQEASPAWMQFLTEKLAPVYDYVGDGRDGGKNGEYCPIFYKRSMYTLLDSGTKWMSDTPDAVSKYPESSLNRIFTYALLEKADGSRIMVVNTHLEHTSPKAREKQAAVLAAFLETVEYPIVLTGDFNAVPDTAEYLTVVGAGVADARKTAEVRDTSATFTDFGKTGSVIDFIFTAGVNVSVHEVIDARWNGEMPSDHNPVIIRYTPTEP